MKAFWLTGTILFSVLILIVAFENIGSSCSSVNFLFYQVGSDVSPTFTFFGIAILGGITGMFIFGLLNSIFAKPIDDEAQDGPATM